jgi:hypothetical protein
MSSWVLPILAQIGDTERAPLAYAILFGFTPAAAGFAVECMRRKGLSPLRSLWMLVFTGLIVGGWKSLSLVGSEWADRILSVLVIGSPVVGIGTGIYFLLPRLERERDDERP